MSGGSMDYIFGRVEDAAYQAEDNMIRAILLDAAKVLHDNEWWLSCDISEKQYRETLDKFKERWGRKIRWIPCSEKLPLIEGEYLVWRDSGSADVLKWCDGWNCCKLGDGTIYKGHEIKNIIAWKHIEPYEGE